MFSEHVSIFFFMFITTPPVPMHSLTTNIYWTVSFCYQRELASIFHLYVLKTMYPVRTLPGSFGLVHIPKLSEAGKFKTLWIKIQNLPFCLPCASTTPACRHHFLHPLYCNTQTEESIVPKMNNWSLYRAVYPILLVLLIYSVYTNWWPNPIVLLKH